MCQPSLLLTKSHFLQTSNINQVIAKRHDNLNLKELRTATFLSAFYG